MKVSAVIIGERHRKDLGDLAPLAQSMAEIGLLHPIVVNSDGVLIAGERRLRAAQTLGWDDIPARVLDLQNIARGEHDENTMRKDFTPSEAVAIWQALENYQGQNLGPIGTEVEPQRRDRAAAATSL